MFFRVCLFVLVCLFCFVSFVLFCLFCLFCLLCFVCFVCSVCSVGFVGFVVCFRVKRPVGIGALRGGVSLLLLKRKSRGPAGRS